MVQAVFDVAMHGARYVAQITLLGEAPAGVFSELCFSLSQPLDVSTVVGGSLVERQGDWHRIELTQPFNGHFVVKFSGGGRILKATDYPDGLYLQGPSGRCEVILDRTITRTIQDDALPETRKAVFIPLCNVAHGDRVLRFPENITVHSSQWNIDWFQRMFARLNRQLKTDDGGYELSHESDTALTVPFELTIAADKLTLKTRDRQGFELGQAYVLQYFLQWSQHGELAALRLSGAEVFDYRGVHLDVVRHFFSAADIIGWFDVLALFQFNHFHWHLTDDDGWRVPSKAFPQLTEVASVRGPDELLPPQMGTGLQVYRGIYSVEEIQAVVARATELAIEVVPEMDLPGHARALLKALPQLVESDDKSVYQSIQHHNDNVINPVFGETMSVIETLIDEWCELFPGRLFHVGSDEIPKGAWQQSPSVLNWSAQTGKPMAEVQGLFLSAIERHLHRHGKTMAGWEEVRDGGGTSTDTWVYSWQGVEPGRKAAEAGHPVVMTPAQFCYLDLSLSEGSADPGQYWAGTVDLKKVLSYRPLLGLTPKAQGNIKGIQLCLWTEVVTSPEEVEYMWFPRLLAGSQLGLYDNSNLDDETFLTVLKHWTPMLKRLGFSVRSEIDGW